MSMLFRITILLLVAVMGACDDSPSGPSDPLAGTYDWVRSTGGIAGRTLTPETEGALRLELDGRGRVRAFRNGTVTAGGYSVVELPTAGPLPTYEVTWTPPLAVSPFPTFDRQTLTFPEPGLFLFSDPCCDGWTHTFAEAETR